MEKEKLCKILNNHIFEDEKIDLLKKLALRPERFVGLFRPTTSEAKLLQHLSQSHEIRFGDAIEELIEFILSDVGFNTLNKNIMSNDYENLSLDQYFNDEKIHYFIEQKIRDDHDSTKKRGQISNFERKLESLYKTHNENLEGFMYFVDPMLNKNKNFYKAELKKLEDKYHIKLFLFYGKELFDYLEIPDVWDEMVINLKEWKNSLPGISEINFDDNSDNVFQEIKNLDYKYWRKIIENNQLWDEGIMIVIFPVGNTLKLIYEYFKSSNNPNFEKLANLLEERIIQYY